MKVLFDECVPRALKKSLSDHQCTTVPQAGLAGKKNGLLLKLAEELGYEVFLTVDRGIEHQQNPAGRKIAIVLLVARSIRLADLLPLMPKCASRLLAIAPAEFVRIDG